MRFMEAEARPGRNDALRLALIETLSPERLPAYEAYFARHLELAPGLLPLLYQKDREVFYRLLATAFAATPKAVAAVRLPNDVFDLSAVAPAFTPTALKPFETVPASLLFARHALAGNNPDVKLVRRALIPVFDGLFRQFLTEEPKALTEEQALETLLLLSVVEEPGGTAFKEEAFLLGKLLADYFGGTIGSRQTALKTALAHREQALAALEKDQAAARALLRLLRYLAVYGAVLGLYLAFGAGLSVLFALNRLIPGKNFSLLHGVAGFVESFAAFLMARSRRFSCNNSWRSSPLAMTRTRWVESTGLVRKS